MDLGRIHDKEEDEENYKHLEVGIPTRDSIGDLTCLKYLIDSLYAPQLCI